MMRKSTKNPDHEISMSFRGHLLLFFEKAQAAPVEEDEKPADVESLRREAWMDDGMPMWPVYYT